MVMCDKCDVPGNITMALIRKREDADDYVSALKKVTVGEKIIY